PNSGWGGPPINNGPQGTCTNAPNENNSAGLPDGLHHINTIGYYGGHPAPVRGNPVGIFGNETNSPVPFSMANPVECDYRAPTLPPAQGGSLTNFNASTNGLTEYTASNFGG